MTCHLSLPRPPTPTHTHFLSGPEFTPAAEHHYSHPDGPQPAARAGCSCCHADRAPCHSGPLLTAPDSGQFATDVKQQTQYSAETDMTEIQYSLQQMIHLREETGKD